MTRRFGLWLLIALISFLPVTVEAKEALFSIYIDEVENETELKIYKDRFTLTHDILPQKIKSEFAMLIEESPLVHAVSVNVPDALIVKIKLRGFTPKRSDILGSTTKAKVYLSVNYHKGGDSSTSWYREYLISDARWNPIYEEEVFKYPWWGSFEKSLYWQTIKKALRRAKNDLYEDLAYSGIRGQIIGITEQKGPEGQKRFLCNLGFEDSINRGDTLHVIRYHTQGRYAYPEVKGRLKVVTVYEHLSIVEIIDEDKEDPIAPGNEVLLSIVS